MRTLLTKTELISKLENKKGEAKKICLELNTDMFCCDNCGGDFTQEEMDFDVNDRDLCKNCNHQSYNDAPYGQRE